VVSLTAILLIGGCLERSSEEVKEIDPRFVELPEEVSDAGTSGTLTNLLDEMEGERIDLIIDFQGKEALPIDVDLRGANGKNLGKWMLVGPGEVTKSVPLAVGTLQIQAFQDLGGDGPTDDDPFGWIDVEMGELSPGVLTLILEEGGKLKHAQSMGHVGAESSVEGPTVQLKMQLRSPAESAVDLDFRSGEDGLVYKAMLDAPGNHNISVPAELGKIQLQAFQDLTGDGPSDDDPFGWISIDITETDPEPVILVLEAGAKLDLAASMGHGDVAQAGQVQPFADYTGAWTLLRGEISGGEERAVQVDFRVPDEDAPGGNLFLGRSILPKRGDYQLQVPRGLGSLVLEVFQDPGNDGPSDDDPYASVTLMVGDVGSLKQDIALRTGTRGQPSVETPTVEAGSGDVLAQQTVFSDLGEDPVQISGVLRFASGVGDIEFIDLDLFAPDTSAPGGRRYLGKLKQKPGPYSFSVPRDFGALELEAFGDLDGDGPTPGDPFGRYTGNPLNVESDSIGEIEIVLSPSG